MARLRSAPSTQQPPPTKSSTRQALKEKTNTTGASALPANELKDFVKDARPTRGRARKAAQNEDELVMAGGLGQKSDAPPSEAPMTTDELAKSGGLPPPTAKANRRPPRRAKTVAQSEAQSKVFEDMKKRMRATAQKEAAGDQIMDAPATSDRAGPSSDALPTKPPARPSNAVAAERSDFSISPSPPPPGKLDAVKNKRPSTARPDSVLKSQSTPAAETSVLALKNFKRRPRQPSMLAMVQQRAAGTRPSAAHAQQATEVELPDPSVFDVEVDDGDEEEFAPDAEGTPLHLRKARRMSAISRKAASPISKKKSTIRPEAQSKKRKSDEAKMSSSSLSALKAKRQKGPLPADDAVAPYDVGQSPEPRVSSVRRQTPQPKVTSDIQVINSSPSTTLPTEQSAGSRIHWSPDAEFVVPSTEEQNQQAAGRQIELNNVDDYDEPTPPDETMAEPLSSSPLPEHFQATQGTDIMAEPLTQITPPRPKRGKEKAEKKAQRMMTATLQCLLPKRRQALQPRRRKSEYDIDSESDEASDGDGEEAADDDADPRNRRRMKTASTKTWKSTAKSKTSTAARKSAAPARSTRKSTVRKNQTKKTTSTGKKPQTKTARTYGRNAVSDKENDQANSDFEELSDNDDSALPDTSLTVHEVAQQSGELAAAKAKFAEVDGWDMEFESVSFEEGRSSSQTWR